MVSARRRVRWRPTPPGLCGFFLGGGLARCSVAALGGVRDWITAEGDAGCWCRRTAPVAGPVRVSGVSAGELGGCHRPVRCLWHGQAWLGRVQAAAACHALWLAGGFVHGLEPGHLGSAACSPGPGLLVPRCAWRRRMWVVAMGDVLRPVIVTVSCGGRWRVLGCGLFAGCGGERGSWCWVLGSAAGLGSGGGGL